MSKREGKIMVTSPLEGIPGSDLWVAVVTTARAVAENMNGRLTQYHGSEIREVVDGSDRAVVRDHFWTLVER